MTATHPRIFPYADEEMMRVAAELESCNPLWIVMFGVYTKQFVGFPRFDTASGTMAVALYPGALMSRMREIEQKAFRYRKSMARAV